jgi:hypothetical protein
VAALIAACLVTVAQPADARPTFGSDPLDDVLHWAAQEKRCGLTTNKLAALMLAPTFPETGAPSGTAPSPMTLSRWDNQPGLHSFGTVADQPRAFWHPGVGAWQFDSAGLGAPFTAAQAIDTYVVSAQAAATMAARWCTNRSLAYVWAPWYGCGSTTCRDLFNTIYRANGDRLVGVNRDAGVLRRGGMTRHSCTGQAKTGRFTCWRVDPSRAQGHRAFAAAGYGPAPISAPFYVYAANGREYRHWLRADTGYARDIWASRPLGANARTGLTWRRGTTLIVGAAGAGAGRGDDEPGTGGGAGFTDVALRAWFVDALQWAVDGEVVAGYPDGTFRGTEPVTRGQIVDWLWTLAGEPTAATRHGFTDVKPSSWLDASLSWAAAQGLVSGFADGSFRPDAPVERSQFASMLWNLAERPVPDGAVPFSDVRASAWDASAVTWLAELGWVDGYPDGTFRGREPVNRAQAVSWLHDGRRFDDVPVSAWYRAAVDWGRYRKVVAGFPDHTFQPAADADRATTVNMLWQTVDTPAGTPHTFTDVVAGDPAVSWASSTGVATGYGDGTFRPGAPVTRAEAVMMLWKTAGRPTGSTPATYSDVSASSWFAEGLAWATGHGLVAGYPDGTFRPNAPVSRAQLTTWVSGLGHAPGAWAPGVALPSTVVG